VKGLFAIPDFQQNHPFFHRQSDMGGRAARVAVNVVRLSCSTRKSANFSVRVQTVEAGANLKSGQIFAAR